MAFDFEDLKETAKEKPWLVYGGLAVAGVMGFLALRKKPAVETVYVSEPYPASGGAFGGSMDSDISGISFGLDQLVAFTQRQSEVTLAAIDTMQRQYHEDMTRLRDDAAREKAETMSIIEGLFQTQAQGFQILNQGLEEALSREYQVPAYYVEPEPVKPPTVSSPTVSSPVVSYPTYTPEPSYYSAPVETSVSSTLLYEGLSGSEVRALQEQLTSLGYNPGTVDSIFGPKTAAALRAFQADMGIKVDAIAGPETFGALQKALAPKPTAGTIYTEAVGPFKPETPTTAPLTSIPSGYKVDLASAVQKYQESQAAKK